MKKRFKLIVSVMIFGLSIGAIASCDATFASLVTSNGGEGNGGDGNGGDGNGGAGTEVTLPTEISWKVSSSTIIGTFSGGRYDTLYIYLCGQGEDIHEEKCVENSYVSGTANAEGDGNAGSDASSDTSSDTSFQIRNLTPETRYGVMFRATRTDTNGAFTQKQSQMYIITTEIPTHIELPTIKWETSDSRIAGIFSQGDYETIRIFRCGINDSISKKECTPLDSGVYQGSFELLSLSPNTRYGIMLIVTKRHPSTNELIRTESEIYTVRTLDDRNTPVITRSFNKRKDTLTWWSSADTLTQNIKDAQTKGNDLTVNVEVKVLRDSPKCRVFAPPTRNRVQHKWGVKVKLPRSAFFNNSNVSVLPERTCENGKGWHSTSGWCFKKGLKCKVTKTGNPVSVNINNISQSYFQSNGLRFTLPNGQTQTIAARATSILSTKTNFYEKLTHSIKLDTNTWKIPTNASIKQASSVGLSFEPPHTVLENTTFKVNVSCELANGWSDHTTCYGKSGFYHHHSNWGTPEVTSVTLPIQYGRSKSVLPTVSTTKYTQQVYYDEITAINIRKPSTATWHHSTKLNTSLPVSSYFAATTNGNDNAVYEIKDVYSKSSLNGKKLFQNNTGLLGIQSENKNIIFNNIEFTQ